MNAKAIARNALDDAQTQYLIGRDLAGLNILLNALARIAGVEVAGK